MRLVSFDALRVLGFPATTIIRPANLLRELETVRSAHWVLFPEYWQVNALVFGLRKRIFPSLASYLVGHDKIEMTRAFEVLAPAHLPQTRILAATPDNAERLIDEMPLPFVAKRPRASMGEGVWLIESRADWRRYVASAEVLYAQEYLPIDRDLRIVWIGKRIVAAYWRLQSPDGFRNNLARGGEIAPGVISPAATELVTRVATQLGVDHAGFDVAMVGNHPYLLEFNRLFGNRGIDERVLRESILGYLWENCEHDDPDHPHPIMPIAV